MTMTSSPAARQLAAGRESAATRKPISRLDPLARRIIVQTPPNAADDLLELKRGLFAAHARIDPKFFYDAAGCALFEQICEQPEYYLTRTEAAILDRHRDEILGLLPTAFQWIDLGCGSGAKSRPWLRAPAARRFVGVDISPDWLTRAVDGVADEFPDTECTGVVTDFSCELALDEVTAERPDWLPVFFYPGSSLGNFTFDAARILLDAIRGHLGLGGALLIGVDLVKDAGVLEAAYGDGAGVTAAFNRNVLNVVNKRLDADFDPDRFEHVALFNREEQRIEMHLRSGIDQIVTIAGERRAFRQNERILTEYSHKYTVVGFTGLLAASGFGRIRCWTDPDGWFAVFLAGAR